MNENKENATTGDHVVDKTTTGSFDVASLVPPKGDPRRPPAWISRALLQACIAVTLTVIIWSLWPRVTWIVVDCVIALFLSLAIEPIVSFLEKHKWKRPLATLTTMTGLAVLIIGLLIVFGSMLASQATGLVKSIPSAYDQLRSWLASLPSTAGSKIELPAIEELVKKAAKTTSSGNGLSSTIGPIAEKTIEFGSGLISGLLSFMTVIIVAYYITAYRAKLMTSICSLIRPSGQHRLLRAWEIVQDQVSGFLYSRILLAAANAVCISVFMIFLHVPYWLPLALFCGLVSQFIPTVGTYLGGALPVLSALASVGLRQAIAILVFIIVYQQIENMVLSPMVSKATLQLNPAIALLSVFIGGAVAGALGAFLAIPVASSVQAVFSQYAVSHQTIDSELLGSVTTDYRSGDDDKSTETITAQETITQPDNSSTGLSTITATVMTAEKDDKEIKGNQ